MTITPGLTPRELHIVHLMAIGHSTVAIAAILGLSPYTVENQKRHLYAKLGVSSQSHAVARALLLGMLDPRRQIRPAQPAADASLVLVHGAPDNCRDQVIHALATHGFPFVVMPPRQPWCHVSWVRWRREANCVVLTDPGSEDWNISSQLDVATLVVRCPASSDDAAAIDDLARGARGLIFADDVPGDLTSMLALTAKGHLTISGVYTHALAKWASSHTRTRPELTARERDILGSIASGHTIRRTGQELGISAKTVENTQSRLFRKLGARNRVEVLAIADGWGLLDRQA